MDEKGELNVFNRMDAEEKAEVLAGLLVETRKRASRTGDISLELQHAKIPAVWMWRIGQTVILLIWGLIMTIIGLRYPTKAEIESEYVSKTTFSAATLAMEKVAISQMETAKALHTLEVTLKGVEVNSSRIDLLDHRLENLEHDFRAKESK